MRSAWVTSLGAVIAATFLAQESRAEPPQIPRPTAATHADALLPPDALPAHRAAPLDVPALLAEDEARAARGLPHRFAVPEPVSLTPETDGVWEELDDGTSVWRLVVDAPGATSLSLGFGRYEMPGGGRLQLYSADLEHVMRPFTSRDNAAHGELWTALLPSSAIVAEVTLPTASRDALDLELTAINVGYRRFGGAAKAAGDKSGSCNVDVVCPSGAGWETEVSSVGAYSLGGSIFCSGFMVNNTSQDGTPYFQTADHCGVDSGNAATLVVYWNFETGCCAGTPDGSLDAFQTGAFFRAGHAQSDFTLVELDELPDPDWGVGYAGWDRSGAAPSSATTVHHPNGDEKRISFENDPVTVTSYYGTASPGDGTHLRVADWDLGTTEGGSSGSPLFDAAQRVVGQLHGGDAACGNDLPDWYGRFSASWSGGGTSATRLSDWLDPTSTGATTLAALAAPGEPASVYASWSFSSDPEWDTEGEWAFGTPSGASATHGLPDPTSGFTGNDVYGYDLDGGYANDLPETHLTSEPIDASLLQGTYITFQRWLNVERAEFDHASFLVSADGTSWTPVWENPVEDDITDACWRRVGYDISGVADGAETLYLRWTMGATDSSWQYTGWNLDDVEIRYVPEPRSHPAAVAGFALLVALARRRARLDARPHDPR